MFDSQPDSLLPDTPLTDLGPLAWVFDALRKSLEGANQAIKGFVRDSALSRQGDLEAADTGALRAVRQQLHQAVGALDMVGLQAPAQVLRAMEAAVQRFVHKPQLCTEAAAEKVERAGFALIEYLEAVLNNKAVQPVALFSQYREVQELAAAERVHPADLWPVDHRGTDVGAPSGLAPLTADARMRSLFERVVLLMISAHSPAAAAQLARMSAGFSVGAQTPRAVTFWRVAAGYFEAMAQKLIPADVYAQHAGYRTVPQLAALTDEKAAANVSETLLHDLLFFCSQAVPVEGAAVPHLRAVREAFGLTDAVAQNYSQASLGLLDPRLLLQARRRITAAKESWSLLAGGDPSRARQAQSQYSLVGDSLLRLHPASTALARALVKATEQVARAKGNLTPELSMEMATTTVYLEAAFENFDPQEDAFTVRTKVLAERLDRVLTGEPAQPLEPWMEQLYRRVSDRQSLGSVVGELRVALGETEKSLDQFFRAPREKACLHLVVSQLIQMRGVLSVLGLEQAVQAVLRMRNTVEQILDTEVDEVMARQAGTFQQLGNNLSALSFMVDMLNYQPLLAKKLFVFDQESGELRPLMGRMAEAVPRTQTSQEDAANISAGVQRVVEDAQQGEVDLANIRDQPGSLADRVSLVDHQGVARAASKAAQAEVSDNPQAGSQAPIGLAQTGPVEVQDPSFQGYDLPGDGDDLLDIFLDEARDLVGRGQTALAALENGTFQLDQLTTLRRTFHTLKGSSRMVGLQEFGEAAWALEQVLNAVLADQRSVEAPLRALVEESLGELDHWIGDIAQHQDAERSAHAFRVSAQVWRERGEYHAITAVAVVRDKEEKVGFIHQPGQGTGQVDGPDASDGWAQVKSDLVPTTPWDLDLGIDPVLNSPLPDAAASLTAGTDIAGDSLLDLGAGGFVQRRDERAAGTVSGGPEPIFDEIVLDLVAQLPQADDLKDKEPGPTFHPDEPDSVLVSQPSVQEEIQDLSLDILDDVAVASRSETPSLPDAHADAVSDEQMRQIGPLRIGVRLYNVYLNEADEWSRRLAACLGEWALERHEPIPETAEALAHSLAGSSATVGFQPLSDIARALEHALSSVALHQRDGQPASPEQAQWFVDAAEDIRRLLHQFAAGFFQEPNATLIAALEGSVHQAAAVEDLESVSGADADPAPDIRTNTGWGVVPQGWNEEAIAPVELVPEAFESSNFAEPATQPSPLQEEHRPRDPIQDIDDDIDVLDTIDVDLFPIFADETLELLPQLGGALRHWMGRPDHASARGEVLRSLHTLKGSARLAGALRLGEMAHSMETAVERMGSGVPATGALESLQAAYDALCARFDQLRGSDVSSLGVVKIAPETVNVTQTTYAPEQDGVEGIAPVPETVNAPRDTPSNRLSGLTLIQAPIPVPLRAGAAVRVRPELLDRLVNQTGEIINNRSRMESQLVTLRASLKELTGNLDRLRHQLRDVELQAETQMQSRLAQAKDAELSFDPLEFDRFTRVQELTRMMAESVNDVATVQRSLQIAVEATEDGLMAQARQTRELQRDLLRTRMVEFEGISERLYRVVRQASKETGKQVRLDITGGHIEMDRGVLDRMTAAFEHLLRNSVVHGIESPEQRLALGKTSEGHIEIRLVQELNDVSVVFRDDGAGLNLTRLREKAVAMGLIGPDAALGEDEITQLVFAAGLSTADEVSSLAGRGVGMDVVRTDVAALGGRIETHSREGQGCSFKLVLPLTTAVTQVVMLRAGSMTIGVPSNQVELVRRVGADELSQSYAKSSLTAGAEEVPFYWAGALLQSSAQSREPQGRTLPVVIFRSAAQRVALHVDAVLGNQEVVVKNLGPQLSRLPGLVGMSVQASGAVALIYNPVALATVYGAQVPAWVEAHRHPEPIPLSEGGADLPMEQAVNAVPLVLVVDDSITVRRVTQRLLQREGYRVALAADGLQALEQLQLERPTVVLSDIEMPRMDGFDLVRNIRNDPRLTSLPVIMITSRIATKHRDHARELGVDHYLGKPYSEEELVALIGQYAQMPSEL